MWVLSKYIENCDVKKIKGYDGEKDFRIPKESVHLAESMRYSANEMITPEQMNRKGFRVDDSGCLRYRDRVQCGPKRDGAIP
jgi:hypothetical protein